MSQSVSNNSVLPLSVHTGSDSQTNALGEIWLAPTANRNLTELLAGILKPMMQPLSVEAAAVYLETEINGRDFQLCMFTPRLDSQPHNCMLSLPQDHPQVHQVMNATEPVLLDWFSLWEGHIPLPPDVTGKADHLSWFCCPITVSDAPRGLLMIALPTSERAQTQWMPIVSRQMASIVEHTRQCSQAQAHSTRLQNEVRLWDGLNRAALAVSSIRTPAEIFDAITTRLAEMGFVAAISQPRDPTLTNSISSLDSEIVSAAAPDAQYLDELERNILGRPIIGLDLTSLPGMPVQDRIAGEGVHIVKLDIPGMIKGLSAPYDTLLKQASARWVLDKAIVAPLQDADAKTATLLIAGANLTPTDLPAVAAFAQHASIAIQNAQLQRQLQIDTDELHANIAARTAEVSLQHERLLAVLESAGSGIVITGPDGVIEYANPAWERLTGRNAAVEIRQKVRIVDEDTFPDLFSGRYGSRDVTTRRSNGSSYTAAVTVTPLVDKDKGGQRLSGLVVVYRDITEYKEIDRLKSHFLSTASHQLRTPLTTVLGFSELLVSRPNLTEDERQRFLQHINDHAQRLKDLIEDLFDISQLESGGEIELDLRPLRLEPALQQEICSWQKNHPDHTYQLVHGEKCPPVLADRERLIKQVIRNLLSNATKYSSAGSNVTITLDPVGKYLEVSVIDQGIGMTSDELQQAFDKFWRADASSTAVDGSGLGLVVAKHILSLHGGQIWVESTPGTGTVVRFTLPVVGHEPTVLIVEDEEHVLEVEDNILRDDGLRTILADNGADALQLAKKHRPDVILLDLMMPRMSGLEVLVALKADPATAAIPVLIVSARTSWKSIEETYKLGAVDFVAKPFEYDELLSRVRRAIDTSKRRSAIRNMGTVS